MSLEFLQPSLDDNMSRTLDPKAQTEIKGIIKAYGVAQFENGRWGVVQTIIEKGKVQKLTIFGHLELEREFAEEHLQRTLQQVEGMRR